MKISLEWLGEFLPDVRDTGTAGAHALGDALTMGGLPVETFEKHGDDDVFDVEVTSNRSDCLSVVGVSREMAALLGKTFLAPVGHTANPQAGGKTSVSSSPDASSLPPAGSQKNARVSVTIDAPELCSFYSARVLRGVTIRKSPEWLERRLEAIGVRPINNVVDITNYVLFELGQPLHAFDFAKIGGGTIVVRRANAGEILKSLDGHERKLTRDMLVIADATRPQALAGVMGGAESEITDQTTDILLESARFDPLTIRKTARALSMKSDSSYRFERGLDPTLARRASDRAVELILQLAGGTVDGPLAIAGDDASPAKPLSVRLEKIRGVLGVDLPTARVVAGLERLGFAPKLNGDRIDCLVPSHRLDVSLEIDLVEEAARVVGYEHIPVRDEVSIRLQPTDLRRAATDKLRQTLVACGCFEAITFSFVSDKLALDFAPPETTNLRRVVHSVRKADGQLRPSVLPGLLESLRHNESFDSAETKLFECGSTFRVTAAGSVETRTLGVALGEDLHAARGTVEAVLRKLDPTAHMKFVTNETFPPGFDPAASAGIHWNNQPVGRFGRVSKATAGKIGLKSLPFVAELELDLLIAGTQHVPQLVPLPKFPAVRRDLSLLLPDAVRFDDVRTLVEGLALPDLESVEYVTTYRGKPLVKGQKSLTITLAFRSPAGTLTSESVDARVKSVTDEVTSKLGATLRS